MSSDRPAPTSSTEERLARVFRLAGYEVQQTVGLEPGTIDWFATPTSGFVRPRTYFRALPGLPEDVEAALADLEAARVARGADRAVAIIEGTTLPDGYVPNLLQRTSNILTYRRFLLEVSEIAEQIRITAATEQSPYLPRRGRLESGEEVQTDDYIDTWTKRPDRPTLILSGPEGSGKATVLRHAATRSAIAFTRDPDHAMPIVYSGPHNELYDMAIAAGHIIPAQGIGRSIARPLQRGWLLRSCPDRNATPETHAIRLELLAPSLTDVLPWVEEHAPHHVFDFFSRACRENADFSAFSTGLANLGPLLGAICDVGRDGQPKSIEQWIALVIIKYVRGMGEALGPSAAVAFEDTSLRQFALEEGSPDTWSDFGLRLKVSRGSAEWFDLETGTFTNYLLLDYFLACKIAREVQAGNSEILFRHQFPPYVFLFLANIAPEVAAKLTQGSVAGLEHKLREEVGRTLHLTVAHLLNRPVGMMYAYLNEIRDIAGKEKAAALAGPIQKIEAEVEYVHNLAERIRIWQTKPEEPIERVALRPLLDDLAGPLRRRYASVTLDVTVGPDEHVRAMRDALRDVFQMLLENAFQAAEAGGADRPRAVTVASRAIGEILRVEVRDSGAGVLPEDRERIFEPLVTTKKGGTGKPRGTGLGLAIARRYAEAMGARVGLDAEQQRTCFFVDLVPWRDEA
jgi:signal transduction histidine kinase